MKFGQDLAGKEEVIAPLIKQILEAALDGETGSHLKYCDEERQSNR